MTGLRRRLLSADLQNEAVVVPTRKKPAKSFRVTIARENVGARERNRFRVAPATQPDAHFTGGALDQQFVERPEGNIIEVENAAVSGFHRIELDPVHENSYSGEVAVV